MALERLTLGLQNGHPGLLSLGTTQVGGAGSEPEHLAGLLSELAMQLAEALPPRSRTAAQVLEALSPGRLQEAIASVSPPTSFHIAHAQQTL